MSFLVLVALAAVEAVAVGSGVVALAEVAGVAVVLVHVGSCL